MNKKSELRELTVTELRQIVRENELEISGFSKMKKDDLIEEIFDLIQEAWRMEDDESETEEVQEVEIGKRGGKKRTINIYKDGELINTIDGLVKTCVWSVENGIANQGWVKNSLRTGLETVPGRKFKEGGYRFEYAD